MAHRHHVQAKSHHHGHSGHSHSSHGGEHHGHHKAPELDYGKSQVAHEAFRKGSNPTIKPIQKKDGGKVPGRKAGGRLDKRARGGGVSKSPFSSAAKGK